VIAGSSNIGVNPPVNAIRAPDIPAAMDVSAVTRQDDPDRRRWAA
jgi:hypothetical protein